MNKKKIVALLVAGVMTIGVVGGTLAWFTDTDSVTNIFETGKINNPENANGNGVEIWEDYDPAASVVPGDITKKFVEVQNTTNYDSFIRVKFEKNWSPKTVTNDEGKEITLNPEVIQLNFAENLGSGDGKWLRDGEYYYYMGKVGGGKFTNQLLESVTVLASIGEGDNKVNTGNEYRGVKFNVEVIAESVQADNGAYLDLWSDASQVVKDKLAGYAEKDSVGKPSNTENDNIVTEVTA